MQTAYLTQRRGAAEEARRTPSASLRLCVRNAVAVKTSAADLLPHDAVQLAAVELPLGLRRERLHHRAEVLGAAGDRLADHRAHVGLGELGREIGLQLRGFLVLLQRQLLAGAGAHL